MSAKSRGVESLMRGNSDLLSRRKFMQRSGRAAVASAVIARYPEQTAIVVGRAVDTAFRLLDPELVQEINDYDAQQEAKYFPESSRGKTAFHVYQPTNQKGENIPIPQRPKRTWFIFPGWGELGTKNIADNLWKVVGNDEQIRYLQLRNDTVDENEIANQFMQSLKEHPLDEKSEVAMLGHSMGTLLFLRMYNNLMKAGVKNIPTVNRMDMLSSPFGPQTAHYGALGAIAAETGIGTGMIGKRVGNFFMSESRDHWDLMPGVVSSNWNYAGEQADTGGTTELLKSMTLLIAKSNDMDALMEPLAPLMRLGPNGYFGADPPYSDNTVDDIPAYNDYNGRLNGYYGADLSYVNNGPGHANYYFDQQPLASHFLYNKG